MKKYIGQRLGEGCEVYVQFEDGKAYPLPARCEIWNHSPSGFEWGYGGSGPAQLALAILADFLGPAQCPTACPYCGLPMKDWKCAEPECLFDGKDEKWHQVVRLHQSFKWDVIAKFRTDRFVLDGGVLAEWIAKAVSL